MQQTKSGRRGGRAVLLILVIAIALIAAVGLVMRSNDESKAINSNLYQAVFLTNGQVYFGKLKQVTKDHADLQDIYYLQTQTGEASEEAEDSSNAADELQNTSSEVKLIKLGNELHGPQDRMLISKQQVLFWENLKNDSKVAEAIKQFKDDSKKE